MNEVKPHRAWAERTLLRAEVFGVAARGRRLRGPAHGRLAAAHGQTRRCERPANEEPGSRNGRSVRTTERTQQTWLSGRERGSPSGWESSSSGTSACSDPLGLALRRNPEARPPARLNVLGKHVPQSPVGGVARRVTNWALRVRELLGDEAAARAVVLGYAETATGLGHSVADGLALAPCLHSTRRPVDGRGRGRAASRSPTPTPPPTCCCPRTPNSSRATGPLVLVDDEFSTGNTVLNTIRDLHARHPRDHYVIVALVDMRSPRTATASPPSRRRSAPAST